MTNSNMLLIRWRCRHCGSDWIPRKHKTTRCPRCHFNDHEEVTKFKLLRERIAGTVHSYPEYKPWGGKATWDKEVAGTE